MSTTELAGRATAAADGATTAAGRALRAERIKLGSLPAVWLTVAGTWIATIILAVAFIVGGRQGDTGTTSGIDIGLAPIGYAQAGFILLGIIATASEYTGRQICTTLAVMPQRSTQRLAQTAVLLGFSFPVAVVVITCSVFLTYLTLGETGGPWDAVQATGAIFGAASYLALTTVLASGISGLLRHSLPAVAVLLGYYFVVGPLVRDMTDLAKYLPDTAGYTMWFPPGMAGDAGLSTAEGWALVSGWTIASVGLSLIAFKGRDA